MPGRADSIANSINAVVPQPAARRETLVESPSAHPLLQLQRAVGNRATRHVLESHNIKTNYVIQRQALPRPSDAPGSNSPATAGIDQGQWTQILSGERPHIPRGMLGPSRPGWVAPVTPFQPATSAVYNQLVLMAHPHPIQRLFLLHYFYRRGRALTLTPQQMIQCNADINLSNPQKNRQFLGIVQEMRSSGTSRRQVRFSGEGAALTATTLGNFTVNYSGVVQVSDAGWQFEGRMDWYDLWDFDSRGYNDPSRTQYGETATRIGARLAGTPFQIFSAAVSVSQTSRQPRLQWAGGSPQLIGNVETTPGEVNGYGLAPGELSAGAGDAQSERR